MISFEKKQALKEEINKTIEIIEKYSKDLTSNNIGVNAFGNNNNYNILYPFATEDMRGYYPEFGHPKKFLTVGGSGDQLLNAIKLGAEKIDVFDSNKLVKRQGALKVESAKVLDAEELYKYFVSFRKQLFTRFNQKLAEEDKIYWDALYDFIEPKELLGLFSYEKLSRETIFQINPYLDKEEYKLFQKKLENVEINYYDSDLYSLPKVLGDNTYDAMNFSNIYEYLNYRNNTNRENAFRYYRFIMEEMYPRLNENGTMMIAYMYAFNERVKKHFEEMYDKYPEKLVCSSLITLEQYLFYKKGFTSQNYDYTLLLNLFEKENIERVSTSHIRYGQSIDMTHDMALFLKE